MLQGRVGLFLSIGMEVVENAAARVGVVHHPVECGDNHTQVHMAVVRQELTDLAQWHGLVIDSPIPRQYPLAEATEGGGSTHHPGDPAGAEGHAGRHFPAWHALRASVLTALASLKGMASSMGSMPPTSLRARQSQWNALMASSPHCQVLN